LNPPTLLLFDECIGRPAVRQLAVFIKELNADPIPEIRHILEFQEEGLRDEEWIPRMAGAGWTVVTADRGKGGIRGGEKLPRICAKLGVTHILLGPSIHSQKSADKILSILAVWPQIIDIARNKPGTRWRISTTGKGEDPKRVRIDQIELPPVDPAPPPGHLFPPG